MITLEKTAFLNGIKAVKSSTAKVGLQPILSNIHIKCIGQALELTATDLNSSARTIVEANIATPIDVCVNAEKLENIVARLGEVITLELKDAFLEIKSGKTRFNCLTLNSEDYPEVKFDIEGEALALPMEDFVNGINKTIFATSPEVLNVLNGVCFTFGQDGYEFASTDGNRLCQIKFEGSVGKEGQYIIPRKTLLDVAKNSNDEVKICLGNKDVVFQIGSTFFKTRLINGVFPKYQQLIPQNQPLNATMKREELIKALEKVAIMCDERTSTTVFNFKNNELNIVTSCENGNAEDNLEIWFEGELKIAFNYRYLLEGIKAMTTEDVTFCMSNALSACVIKSDDNFLFLCMPVQLRKDQ